MPPLDAILNEQAQWLALGREKTAIDGRETKICFAG